MSAKRSLLLASTVLSGMVAMANGPNASAAPWQGQVLAQAAPAGHSEDAKHRAQPKPPAHPVAPRPPAPPVTHAPQAQAPQPSRQPAPNAASVHNNKPEGARPPERTQSRPPQPKVQPAQVNPRPSPQHPNEQRGPAAQERHATPATPGQPGPNERSQSRTPTPPQSTSPPGRTRPAEAAPPATQHNAGPQPVSPPGRTRPAEAAPPATQHNAASPPGGGPQAQPPSTVVRRAAPPQGNPAAVPPPTQALNKGQFIAPKGQAPAAGMGAVRAERHEVREGNQTIIREPDRTIVQEGNRTFIRHNEDDRFAVGARNVQVERHGNGRMTTVWRPDGVQIIDFDDDDGHLIRRVRRDRDGREVVLIDNGFAGPRGETVFLDLPPPVVRIPQDRYIVDADRADEAAIYGVLVAAPIERLAQRYTLDQVRFNEPLRALMPRLDLEINFDTGSWQMTADQVDRLSALASALRRAIGRDPREVFLIEGYTDAVGSDVDNLSLSDRRAEAVAVALTEQFGVPAENLVTQGYGKQFLKVQTDGPERANRRVAVRRITPLIDPQAVGLR